MNQLPLIKGYAKPILLLRFASSVTTLRIAVVGHTGSRKKVTTFSQPFVTRLNPKTPIMHTHNFHSRTSIHTTNRFFLESSSLYCHLLIHLFLFIFFFHSCHLFFFSPNIIYFILPFHVSCSIHSNTFPSFSFHFLPTMENPSGLSR